MHTLQALLLDVDGTLADTERTGHLPAFNEAFAAAGLDWRWSPELYGELLAVSGGRERIVEYLRVHRPDVRLDATVMALVGELHADKNRRYAAAVAAGRVPLRPGVARLLEEAAAEGLRLAIVTTTSPENVDALLRHGLGAAAGERFEAIVAGDAVAAKKPAPDAYLLALELLRLDPRDCLALEDSGNGLRAALAAGVPTLVTVSEFAARDDFSGAAAVVDGLGEPDAPVHVLAGDPGGAFAGGATCDRGAACDGGAAFVDVAALRALHARAQATAGERPASPGRRTRRR
jgi:HAD superfamily hydrolase (TIGR01509 family)